MNEVNFSRAVKEVKFGAWTLDPKRQTITDGDVTRELEPLLFKILCYLILNNDQIITRDDLVNDVWCQNYVDNNAINRAMSELRKVLKSDKQRGLVVKTHYRKGYSFFLDPEIIYQDIIPQASVTPVAKVQPKVTPQQKAPEKATFKFNGLRTASFLIALVMVVAGVGFLSPTFNLNSDAPNAQSATLEQVKYTEELLSWMPGRYMESRVSPNKEFVAFSFVPEGLSHQSLVVKNLKTGLERKTGDLGIDYYPLGWSVDSSKLFYRLTEEDKCEIWVVDRDFTSNNRYLFDCTSSIEFGAGAGGDSFVYSKFNYRGRDQLSVLMNYNLETGEEFQLTSPNLNSYGDLFLLFEPSNETVFFTRRQYDAHELYMTDLEGSYQTKLYESKTPIWAVSYEGESNTLRWFCNATNQLFEFSLDDSRLTNKVQFVDSGNYASPFPLSKEQMIAVSYPYKHDIYEFDLVQKGLSPTLLSEDIKFSGFIKNEKVHYLALEHEKWVLKTVSDAGEPSIISTIGSPYDSFPSVNYDAGSGQTILRSANKVLVFDNSYTQTHLIETENTILSAEFLLNGDIGYVVVDENQKKNEVYIYSLETEQSRKLPIEDAVWFTQLSDNRLVYRSNTSALNYFDLTSGVISKGLQLPESTYGHLLALGGGNLYYSNGKQVYRIIDNERELLMELNGKTAFSMRYAEDRQSLVFTTFEESSNHLLQLHADSSPSPL
ncbi:winged helix-turn-helix domain-containing protein [Pseudoalteromonas rubra]|uniref:Transcriptional regulator n=1 Tax=Pseudoalteromonas rubra TaxID=43658 RepID=A0A5S3WXM5_9GAMM|nr:winged helix-turn-helix domain-containing protein [Pseudoalteromonas rubra]TMP34383.1 transcriptional regulator [Pseudoalteromonas rubra]